MLAGTHNPPFVRGNLLPQSSLAEAVARRAMHVTDLLLTRRKVALAYRRRPSDEQLAILKTIDTELAKYNINILTIPSPRPKEEAKGALRGMSPQAPRMVPPEPCLQPSGVVEQHETIK